MNRIFRHNLREADSKFPSQSAVFIFKLTVRQLHCWSWNCL